MMSKQNLCQSSENKDDKIENVSEIVFMVFKSGTEFIGLGSSLQNVPCRSQEKREDGGWLQTCKHEVQHVTFCSVVFGDFVLFFFFLLLLILSYVIPFSLARLSA